MGTNKYIFNPLTQKLDTVNLENPADSIELLGSYTKEPTGHLDRTESIISFDSGTRTFTIAPVNTSFTYFIKGRKYEVTDPISVQLPDVSGGYTILIDDTGQVVYTTSPSVTILTDYAYSAYIYWNSIQGEAVYLGEERHSITIDWATHAYLHRTRGTQLAEGAAIGFTTGDGSLDGDMQISLSDMTIVDEDIFMSIQHSDTPSGIFEQVLSPVAEIPTYYRLGDIWHKETATQFPLKQGTTRPQYNRFDSGWLVEDATADGKVLASYIFATNDIREPVVCIIGQDQYDNIEDALMEAAWDKINFGDVPFEEIKLLYILFYEVSSAFSNTPKARILEVRDVRFNIDREFSAVTQNTDHSNLSGLGVDSHLQYLHRSGVRPMEGDLNMGNNDITNVGTVNSVVVEGHASRHLPSGADPIATGVASTLSADTINAIGNADSFAISNHTHAILTAIAATINTNGINTLGSSASLSRADHTHKVEVFGDSVNANNVVSTTSGTPVLLPGMQISGLPTGSYLILGTAMHTNSGSGNVNTLGLYIGGTLIPNTDHSSTVGGGGFAGDPARNTYAIGTIANITSGQNLEIRWSRNAGTASVGGRSLIAIRVS